MIRCITGDFGSGKTARMTEAIQMDVAAGRNVCLLVPEQQTVLTERVMADLLPPDAPLRFEVSNFSRLANTVFRRVGGLSYRYADAATRTLCMWRTMAELLPLLHEKEGEVELGRVRRMTAAMAELSSLSLSPARLSAAAAKLEVGSRLREKLEDLALLSTTYHALLSQTHDDVGEDLDRLGDLLYERRPMADTHLYLDGFISYTEQEYRVLRALASQCEVTLTLTLPAAREDALCFEETRATLARLRRMAEEAGVPFLREDVGEPRRMASPLLKGALLSLFEQKNRGPVWPEDEGDVLRFFSAEDAMEEAAFVAADIARRVMEEGAHYRDFAVIAARVEDYAGVLDVAMADAEIPAFMARGTDIASYPAIKLIYSAYAIATANWRQGDVISYLKCGMAGFSEEEVDMFELYVTRWKLHGRRFTDEMGWSMNPDGYTATLTERGAEILRRVEGVRARLVEQLTPLVEGAGRHTVPEHCRTLYEFLLSLSVEEQLLLRAEEARVLQNNAEADELGRLFGVLTEALDRLAATLPDVTVGAEDFLALLRLLLGEVKLSRIPTAVDEVTVGSASVLRVGEPRHVYLIGANDGVFPAPVSEDSVFSDGDRRTLAALGLSVEPQLLLRSARELFCFARAFAAARESVTVLYANASLAGAPRSPSACVRQLSEGTGLPVRAISSLPPLALLWRRGPAEDRLGILSGTPEGEALANAFRGTEEGQRKLARIRRPLVEADCRLSPQTTEALWRGGIALTQSRMDTYAQCPFSFFCRHVLRLESNRVIEFDYSDVGSLVHTILERLFSRLGAEGHRFGELSAEALHALSEEILDGYVREICPGESLRTPRLLHLFSRLRRALYPVVEELYAEFSQSEFAPTFFELSLGEGGDTPTQLPFVLPDGTAITLYGRIDRVDTWQKDGKTYLRVVDYKSGRKSFSLADIERGLNTQLLVYLFSLWKSTSPAFLRRVAPEGGELVPAGVLYAGTSIGERTYGAPLDPQRAYEDARLSLPRSGLFLSDPEVLRAMDKELDGRFIPVKLRKDGGFYAASEKSLASLERMGELVGTLDRVICRIGRELKEGNAAARPLASDKRKYYCEHCDMAPVCRSARK